MSNIRACHRKFSCGLGVAQKLLYEGVINEKARFKVLVNPDIVIANLSSDYLMRREAFR